MDGDKKRAFIPNTGSVRKRPIERLSLLQILHRSKTLARLTHRLRSSAAQQQENELASFLHRVAMSDILANSTASNAVAGSAANGPPTGPSPGPTCEVLGAAVTALPCPLEEKHTGADASSSNLLEHIERLKKEQKDLKTEKKRVAKELKNAEKRRARLRKRAKQLSDGDLLEVIKMRASTSSSSTQPGSVSTTPSSSTPLPAGTIADPENHRSASEDDR